MTSCSRAWVSMLTKVLSFPRCTGMRSDLSLAQNITEPSADSVNCVHTLYPLKNKPLSSYQAMHITVKGCPLPPAHCFVYFQSFWRVQKRKLVEEWWQDKRSGHYAFFFVDSQTPRQGFPVHTDPIKIQYFLMTTNTYSRFLLYKKIKLQR